MMHGFGLPGVVSEGGGESGVVANAKMASLTMTPALPTHHTKNKRNFSHFSRMRAARLAPSVNINVTRVVIRRRARSVLFNSAT